jgi:hypothetical protein
MNAMGGNGISMGHNDTFQCIANRRRLTVPRTIRPRMFTSNHYTTGTKFYAQTTHLIIPELLCHVEGGTWDKLTQGRAGAGEQVCARSAAGAARPVGQKRGRVQHGKLKAAGVQFVAVDQKARSLMPRLRCAPSTARKFGDLMASASTRSSKASALHSKGPSGS